MRDWVEKFDTGVYLRKWKGYEPILITGPYSEDMNIGEEKFINCIGWFSGIGDVDWWITAEIDKLKPTELVELEQICEYKTYLDKVITIDLIKRLAALYNCETHHVYRIGRKKIQELCADIMKYKSYIIDRSRLEKNY